MGSELFQTNIQIRELTLTDERVIAAAGESGIQSLDAVFFITIFG